MDYLWDVDEVYRLANMAKHEPTLMTYDEEMLWRVIQEEPGFWIETEIPLPSFERVYWEYMEGIWLNIPLVRQAWEVVKAVADMEVDPDELSCRVDELKSQMEMRGSGD